jgi:hypothetical protein
MLTLSTVIFADDQVLIAESEDDQQREVFELQHILKYYNMEISEEKTKSMAVTGKTPRLILINNKIIEQRMDFIYLGSHNSQFEHQKRKLMKYNKLNGVWRRNFGKQKRKDLQIRFQNVIAKRPSFMAVNAGRYVKKIETFNSSQVKFIRPLTGVTLRDRIKSEDLRNLWRVHEVVQEVQNYQFKCMQHVLRMPANRLSRKLLKYKPRGRTDLKRPHRRWADQFL